MEFVEVDWFMCLSRLNFCDDERANGARYPLVGGTRERHLAGTHFKPRKLLENAQTPTSRVHAVLGAVLGLILSILFSNTISPSWAQLEVNVRTNFSCLIPIFN
jgi:hypothetical protein